MMSKILKSFWIILDNLPRLKESIYKFYAWRIFEIVPWFKKIIYKFYDKFWYLELSIDSKNQDLSKNLPNEFTIDIKRLNYYIDYKIYLKNKNLNIDKNWDNSSNLNKIEESNEFILLKEHFLNKKKWKEIDLYHILNDQLTQYKKIIENSGGNQFVELLNSLDKLYQNFNLEKIKTKIKVGIGSRGEFILIEGIFYVSLLRILDENIIPSYVPQIDIPNG